jgi:hypothetical protein
MKRGVTQKEGDESVERTLGKHIQIKGTWLMLEEERGRILEQMAQINLVLGNTSTKTCRWRKLMFTNNLLRRRVMFYTSVWLRPLNNMHTLTCGRTII